MEHKRTSEACTRYNDLWLNSEPRYPLCSAVTHSIAGSNGIDIEVSRHHTVSVSNFQSIEVSSAD